MGRAVETEEKPITKINIKDWIKTLDKSGYRITGPRKIIINKLLVELGKTSRLLSADDIYLLIKRDVPNIGIATLYRTLELLTRLDLISKINFGGEKSFYKISDDYNYEYLNYMICSNCRKIVYNNKCLNSSIKIRLKEDAEKNILENCGIKIKNYQVVFSGLCDNCI